MKSMTGYGISRWKSNDCYIEVVVQSYNSKNFESRVQIPPFYSSLEGELRKELQKKFSRGFISLLVNRSPSWPVKQTMVQWNKKQALKWRALYNKMASALKIKNNLDLVTLAQQTGVMEVLSQPALVSSKEKSQLKALMRKAIDLCDKERVREGLALKKDFQKNIKQLSLCLQRIKSHSLRQNEKASKNIKEKIRSVDLTDEQRTIQDVTAALISRLDTSEEFSRMEEHIRVFRTLVIAKGVMGKKISFYLQEMIREVNTIGSKSQDFKLTQEVVQAKTLIERMREQVNNVE